MRCNHCGGSILKDGDTLKCLACSREVLPPEEKRVVEYMANFRAQQVESNRLAGTAKQKAGAGK